MPLRITRRTARGKTYLQIVGTVVYPDGSRQRVRQAPQSGDIKLAREEAAALEAQLLRTAWHGERRAVRPFAEAVESYIEATTRRPSEVKRLLRIVFALGDVPISAVDQGAVNLLKKKMFLRPPSDATVNRELITPIRTVLRHAHRRGWCDPPTFEIPRVAQGRTSYLLPSEMDRLLLAAAPHLRPLLFFLVGTGARMSEALELEWRDVDLVGKRATFWQTKNGRRRVAELPPAVIATLTALPHREGNVFLCLSPTNRVPRPYRDTGRDGGGQIKTAWRGALRRSGLGLELRPHDLRHTWASWHYALHRDLLRLKIDGGWSSVDLVERYAHLLPAGHEAEIIGFLGWRDEPRRGLSTGSGTADDTQAPHGSTTHK